MKTRSAFAFRRFYKSLCETDEDFQRRFFDRGFNEPRINFGEERIGSIEQAIRLSEHAFSQASFLLARIRNHERRLKIFQMSCEINSESWQRAHQLQRRYEQIESNVRYAKDFFSEMANHGRDTLRHAFNEELGVRLRLARRRQGIKQETAAKFLGVKKSAYSHYELGRREIPPVYLYRLAEFFKVPIAWLLG